MKVQIETINGMHNYAQCRGCEWDADGSLDSSYLSKLCQQHVRKTGHTVVREVANSITYSPLP